MYAASTRLMGSSVVAKRFRPSRRLAEYSNRAAHGGAHTYEEMTKSVLHVQRCTHDRSRSRGDYPAKYGDCLSGNAGAFAEESARSLNCVVRANAAYVRSRSDMREEIVEGQVLAGKY